MLPSLLVRLRPGVVLTGVVSILDALVVPFVITTPLTSCVVPAGTGVITSTANVADPVALPANVPIVSEHVVPPGAPLAQLQPAVLPAERNVALPGTCSLMTTPLSAILPVF